MRLTLLLISLFVVGLRAAPQAIVPHVINGQRQVVQHAAAVFAQTNADGSGVFGGGSIVSNRIILTGANVIFGAIRVRVGYGSDELGSLTGVDTTTFIIHPLFNRTSLDNDIAIIRLSALNAIDFDTDTVRPIALPAQGAAPPAEGEFGSVAGFGYTQSDATELSPLLLVANLAVAPMTNCTERFPNLLFTTHFCVGGAPSLAIPSLISNICAGDNGAGYYTGDGFIPTTTPEPTDPPTDPTGGGIFEEIIMYEKQFEGENEDGNNGPPEYWDESLESDILQEDAREGDDGSPTEGETPPMLIGIASVIGNPWTCIPTDARGMTLVANYVDWILDWLD